MRRDAHDGGGDAPPSPLPGVGEGRACRCRRDGGFQNGAPEKAGKGSAFHMSSAGGSRLAAVDVLVRHSAADEAPEELALPARNSEERLGGDPVSCLGSAIQHWATTNSAVLYTQMSILPASGSAFCPSLSKLQPHPRCHQESAPLCATCPGPSVASDDPLSPLRARTPLEGHSCLTGAGPRLPSTQDTVTDSAPVWAGLGCCRPGLGSGCAAE